jgi:hypothetical protein
LGGKTVIKIIQPDKSLMTSITKGPKPPAYLKNGNFSGRTERAEDIKALKSSTQVEQTGKAEEFERQADKVSDYQTYSKSSRFLIICKTFHLICTGIKGILLQEQELEHERKERQKW